MNLLLDLNINKDQVEAADELESVLKGYKKSRFEILRDLSKKILDKWKYMKAVQNE